MQKRDITAKKVGFKPFNATNVHKYINKHRYINKHTLIVYVYIYMYIWEYIWDWDGLGRNRFSMCDYFRLHLCGDFTTNRTWNLASPLRIFEQAKSASPSRIPYFFCRKILMAKLTN
jgi:hypothetical protein